MSQINRLPILESFPLYEHTDGKIPTFQLAIFEPENWNSWRSNAACCGLAKSLEAKEIGSVPTMLSGKYVLQVIWKVIQFGMEIDLIWFFLPLLFSSFWYVRAILIVPTIIASYVEQNV